MYQNTDTGTDGAPVSGTSEPAGDRAAPEHPSVRGARIEPVRVGWIVDAQPELLDRTGRLHVLEADGGGEVATAEAVAALTRAVDWMGGWCPVLVYTGHWPAPPDPAIPPGDPGPAGGTPLEARDIARLIASIRPVGPLVLDPHADDEEAEDLGYRAIEEGRSVVAHRTGAGVFEEQTACGAFLGAVEDAYYRPVEVLVTGIARGGSVARVADGLLKHGHRVIVVRDAIFTTGPEPEEGPASSWAGRGSVQSLAEVRESVPALRQISFADIEFEEAYERLDSMMTRRTGLTPLPTLDALVPWNLYRARLYRTRMETSRRSLEDLVRTPEPLPEFDVLVAFKAMLLGTIYDLSDEQVAFLLHDRLSFKRFAGLGMTDEPPSGRLLRTQRERWTRAGVMEDLFADVDARWQREGYRFRGLRRYLGPAAAPVMEGGVRLEVQGPEPARWMVPKGGGGKPAGGGGKKRLSRRQRRKKKKRR